MQRGTAARPAPPLLWSSLPPGGRHLQTAAGRQADTATQQCSGVEGAITIRSGLSEGLLCFTQLQSGAVHSRSAPLRRKLTGSGGRPGAAAADVVSPPPEASQPAAVSSRYLHTSVSFTLANLSSFCLCLCCAGRSRDSVLVRHAAYPSVLSAAKQWHEPATLATRARCGDTGTAQ